MLAVGCDIVSVARIAAAAEKHGERFLQRCFRPDELALAETRGARAAETLASRWAAKEAFVKALGQAATGVAYRDVEVVRGSTAVPELRLHGQARIAFDAQGAARALLSLSHEREHAMAVVILT
jgi:holo-[acyl-carrier protein] synthase